MQALQTLMHKFLSQADTQFIIPVYQRNYDWTRVQWKQLVDDILNAGSSPELSTHFIGSLVFIHDDVYTTGEVTQLTIIDGQQRITTLTLIHLILCQKYRKMNDCQTAEKIYKKFLINEFHDTKEKLKLRATANNDKAFLYLLKENPGRPYPEYSRIIENYNYLKERIVTENMDIIRQGLNKLLFVEVSLERGRDDPQKIFESLNSTGLDLSQADLIRNYFLEQLENHNNRELVKIEGNPDLSIEHIFPQAPHPQWRKDLDETYYYERNLSSKHKFDRLKEALTAVDCEEVLFIMYADSRREISGSRSW